MQVICSWCHAVVSYPDDAEGKIVMCPHCGDHFILTEKYLDLNKFLVPLAVEIRSMKKQLIVQTVISFCVAFFLLLLVFSWFF